MRRQSVSVIQERRLSSTHIAMSLFQGVCVSCRRKPRPPFGLDAMAAQSNEVTLLVKVDCEFWRTESDVYGSVFGYPRKIVSIDYVVFDEKGDHMIMRLGDDEVIDHFSNLLKEGREFYVQHFAVDCCGEGIHSKFLIKLMLSSKEVECQALMPMHCFKLCDVANLEEQCPHNSMVTDIMGFLYTIGPLRKVRFRGMMTYKLAFVVADRRGNHLSVVLYGESAKDAKKDFEVVSQLSNLILIVQFGLISKVPGKVTMTNYASATKVFWNPRFNKILKLRASLLSKRHTRKVQE